MAARVLPGPLLRPGPRHREPDLCGRDRHGGQSSPGAVYGRQLRAGGHPHPFGLLLRARRHRRRRHHQPGADDLSRRGPGPARRTARQRQRHSPPGPDQGRLRQRRPLLGLQGPEADSCRA